MIETRKLIADLRHRADRQEHDRRLLLRPAARSTRAASRPGPRHEKSPRRDQGRAVLGAGMMGAGIAQARARGPASRSSSRTSRRRTPRRAAAYSQLILTKAFSRGKSTQEKADEVLARITPTADLAHAQDADVVIEAVFEEPATSSRKVFAEVVQGTSRRTRCSPRTRPRCRSAELADRRRTARRLRRACTSSRPSARCRCSRSSVGRARPATRHAGEAHSIMGAAASARPRSSSTDGRGFFTSRVIGKFIEEADRHGRRGRASPASIEHAALASRIPRPAAAGS